MSVVAAKQPQKTYLLVDKKPFFKHFYPKDVAILAVRSVATQGLMIFNAYVASLDMELSDEESSEDDFADEDAVSEKKDDFVLPTIEEFGVASSKSFVKSLTIITYVRSFEEVALRYCRPQTVSKLIKDISKSAMRKYARTSSRLTSAAMMIKTGMRANMLSHLAIFLVEETQQLVLILYRRYLLNRKRIIKFNTNLRIVEEGIPSHDSNDDEDSIATFMSSTGLNASRSALAVITGGVGAALGTAVRPGIGTMIGGTLGDSIAYILI
ncbi:uncharacterized protein PHALS_07048 [Plasmopara halstedii]|uniref:Uncharacterized protein n=1 Tax=Plasmopara halstedii TaxID=4781 RepID=A0A0P1B5E6_PLAHL|nr:uncharacterized protein PHALS_07048 [Plasmopara halstedii]CEG49276.1 hypothetical protein PHALS_07048 [Plasmopara halstedii]|eukprot:XP_024585645.1 hypothetical protein PHALS_07048 [Plasmopara halstedii]